MMQSHIPKKKNEINDDVQIINIEITDSFTNASLNRVYRINNTQINIIYHYDNKKDTKTRVSEKCVKLIKNIMENF